MINIYDLMPQVSDLISYPYEKIKSDVYECIINSFLAKLTKQKHPTFIQVGGVPGAGKTTFCQRIANNLFLSFDAVMESIPEYQQDLYLIGNVKSFHKWEMPARVIGYEILARAINARYNIVLEHSGVNQAHMQLFKNLKILGYNTSMYFITCRLDLAINRTKEREKITHRFTPQAMIEQRYNLVNQYIKQYQSIADNTYVYDSSKNNFIMTDKFCA